MADPRMSRQEREAHVRSLPTRNAAVTLGSLALLAALVAAFQVVRGYDPAAARIAAGVPGESALSATGAVMTSRYRGHPQWRLQVGQVVLRRSPDSDLTEFHTAQFRGIREGVVYGDGALRATFAADRATYERMLRRLEVQGRIRLRSPQGDAFRAERCVWTEKDDFARFPSGARGRIGRDTVNAPVMLYQTRLRVVQCPAGASAVFRGQPIEAAALEWDVEARRILCTGPVSGRRGDLEFLAQRAELDLRARTIRVNKGAVDFRMESRESPLKPAGRSEKP
jgi:hypothetical protein